MQFVVVRTLRAGSSDDWRPKFRHDKHLLGPAYTKLESSGLVLGRADDLPLNV